MQRDYPRRCGARPHLAAAVPGPHLHSPVVPMPTSAPKQAVPVFGSGSGPGLRVGPPVLSVRDVNGGKLSGGFTTPLDSGDISFEERGSYYNQGQKHEERPVGIDMFEEAGSLQRAILE
eukprot:EG_transcript_56226